MRQTSKSADWASSGRQLRMLKARNQRFCHRAGCAALAPRSPKLAGAGDDLVQLGLGVAAAVGERAGQVLPVGGVQAIGFAGDQHFEPGTLLGVMRRLQSHHLRLSLFQALSYGTERMRQKLFVVGSSVLVSMMAP